MNHPLRLAWAWWLLFAPAVHAQSGLPVLTDVSWQMLRDHCRQLLRALPPEDQPLPAATVQRLRDLLQKEPADAAAAIRQIQQWLDPHCLLAVDINPESRVKAVRGPAPATLRQGEPTIVLVKVHNEGVITHSPQVHGPGIAARGAAAGSWLEAAFVSAAPLTRDLSGARLEYRFLQLTAHEAGQREATFRIDVGQGTQDLGFHAEVPILFRVQPR